MQRAVGQAGQAMVDGMRSTSSSSSSSLKEKVEGPMGHTYTTGLMISIEWRCHWSSLANDLVDGA